MCFSATASFTASLALVTCGIAALKYAQEKKITMIAAIPLIFGLQQFAEGMVWVSFLDSRFAFVRMTASYVFLIFAAIIWPIWIPIAIARFEGSPNYKRYLPSVIAGGLCALTFILYVLFYDISVLAKCNIVYNFDVTQSDDTVLGAYIKVIASLLYIVATIVPFFIACNKTFWFLGALTAISYIISYVAYFEAFTSVWCFFAALISLLVYAFVRDQAHRVA